MSAEVLKSIGTLKEELEKAKDHLKGVDDTIKRLIGRDPNEGPTRPGQQRRQNSQQDSWEKDDFRGRGRGIVSGRRRGRPDGRQDEGPASKRRPREGGVFARLAGPVVIGPRIKRAEDSGDEDELDVKPAVQSRVIPTPKDNKSRQEAMAEQRDDEKSKARNRRMFGALLGTLQKFRQEESRLKEKEDKRAKIEKKLEDNAKREKEELKKEKQDLFLDRKRKQAEIRRIELKMLRMKEQEEWEEKHRPLVNFIQTKSRPHIFFLPKVHNSRTEERLVVSQKVVARMIERKREELQKELQGIEERGRWREGGAEGRRGVQEGVEEFEEEEEEEMDEERGGPVEELGDKENQPEILGGVGVSEEVEGMDTETGKSVEQLVVRIKAEDDDSSVNVVEERLKGDITEDVDRLDENPSTENVEGDLIVEQVEDEKEFEPMYD